MNAMEIQKMTNLELAALQDAIEDEIEYYDLDVEKNKEIIRLVNDYLLEKHIDSREYRESNFEAWEKAYDGFRKVL